MTALFDTYRNKTHPLAIALAVAQERGIKIDIPAREALRVKIEARIAETATKLTALVGSSFNPASPKQVKELLYDKMKFPVMFSKTGDTITTDEEAIKKLRQRYPDEPVLNLILEHRKDSKLLSTFIDVPIDADGRMRTSYNASGTGTYRISSSKNIFGKGMNLQNIPVGKRPGIENVRNLFISDDGCSLIKGDLVQAEAMVVAWILTRYGDMTLYNKYHTVGFDIHRWTAAPLFGVPEAEITKWQRSVGKIGTHSGNYVAGPRVLQSTAIKWDVEGMTYDLAKKLIDIRHQMIPGLKTWWAGVEQTLRRTRTITTCLGYRRQFFDRPESALSSAVAFEPQSSVGVLCNLIFTKLHQLSFEMLLQVHDEVVFQVKDDKIADGVAALREAAKIPLLINPGLEPLTIPIEISVGKNWRDCEEVK